MRHGLTFPPGVAKPASTPIRATTRASGDPVGRYGFGDGESGQVGESQAPVIVRLTLALHSEDDFETDVLPRIGRRAGFGSTYAKYATPPPVEQ